MDRFRRLRQTPPIAGFPASVRAALTRHPRGEFLAGIAGIACASLAAGCDAPSAFGEPNSLIVVAPDSLWEEVADTTYAAIETPLPIGRGERVFAVTQASRSSENFERLLLWRQVLVFAPPGDPLLERAAEAAGVEDVSPGHVFQAEDVWARGQLVTAAVLDPERPVASWGALLPEVDRAIDRTFREFVHTRMFASGVDSTVADSLQSRFGFSVRVPAVYDLRIEEEADLVLLRNDNPDPSRLIRELAIQARPARDSLAVEAIAEWRASIDSAFYGVPQQIEVAEETARRIEVDGQATLEVMGRWIDESDYPAAGPFIARAVRCPGRTVFLDAWLYSPDPEQAKYQYLIQLRTILDSFRCGPAPGAAASSGATAPPPASEPGDTANAGAG